MPIYEYECQACGQQSEFLMKISDPSPSKCDICQQGPLEKLMSQTSFVLKGEGWYETDFKEKKSVEKPKSSQTKESSSGSAPKETANSTKETAASSTAKTDKKTTKNTKTTNT